MVGAVALLVLGAGAWLINRRVAQPLRALTDRVRDVGAGHPAERVPEKGSAEIISLARAFNAMGDIRRGHEARLVHLATHDEVTGLPNAAFLRDALERALAGGDVSLLCVGISRFQLVTDSIGHDAGNQVLATVADRLTAVAGPDDTVARLGGPRFAVLAPGVTGARVVDFTEGLVALLAEPITGTAGGTEVMLSPAIGVASSGAHSTPEQLLREADTAMAHARTTHVSWARFEASMQAEATTFLATGEALRHATARNELLVHYQPVVDLRNGAVIGAEALVRWQHPTRGLLGPAAFIPVAEATGQITAIGSFVMFRACQEAATWASHGRSLRVSVNVASEQLRGAGFVTEVAAVLARTGLPADRLCLELTESDLISAEGGGVGALSDLRSLGVHLSIDDFGTGYSSLSYLHDLPFDEVKIDRSFISRITHQPRDRRLVEAILGMAEALDLSVVAEGVEETGQLDALIAMGCRTAQGYWFAKPLSPEDFAQLAPRFAIGGLVPAQR